MASGFLEIEVFLPDHNSATFIRRFDDYVRPFLKVVKGLSFCWGEVAVFEGLGLELIHLSGTFRDEIVQGGKLARVGGPGGRRARKGG